MRQSKPPALGELPVFLGLLTFLLTFFLLSRTPADADMWWHLRAGQVMWEQKEILLTDPFSYTRAGQSWTNAFWLSEIIFYLLYRYGGYIAISTFTALMGGATFFLIYRRLYGSHLLNSAIILLAAITAAPVWSPRPQIFSFLLLAVLDKFLDDRRRGEHRPLWGLIPLFVLWANIHGGWVWGFLLLAAHIMGSTLDAILQSESNQRNWRQIGSLIVWTLAAALGLALNPNGLSIWKLPFHTVNVSMQIQEWLSPDFHRIDFHPLLWMIFLLVVTASLSSSKPNWTSLLKVTGFAYLTFVWQRNIAPFAIISAPVLASWANAAFEETVKPPLSIELRSPNKSLHPAIRTAINSSVLVLLALIAVARLFWLSTPQKVVKDYPAAAVEWIHTNRPEGRIFNSYNWGGFLLWRLPEYPVFIDGRADLYGDDVISQWQAIAAGTDRGFALLEEWQIEIILLEPNKPLVNVLEQQGWNIVFHDEISVILIRE